MNPPPSIDADLAFKLFRAGRDTVWSGSNPDRIVGAIMEAVDGRADQARLRELVVEWKPPRKECPPEVSAERRAISEEYWRRIREDHDDHWRKCIQRSASLSPLREKRWDKGRRMRLGLRCMHFRRLLTLTFKVKGKRESDSWADRLYIGAPSPRSGQRMTKRAMVDLHAPYVDLDAPYDYQTDARFKKMNARRIAEWKLEKKKIEAEDREYGVAYDRSMYPTIPWIETQMFIHAMDEPLTGDGSERWIDRLYI